MSTRFQVIPRTHTLPVGAELTGLVEHGVPCRAEAEAIARRTSDMYALRYGPGCPAHDVIEVVTVRPLGGPVADAIVMQCVGRWPVADVGTVRS